MIEQNENATTQREFLEYLLSGEMEPALELARNAMDRGISPIGFFETVISPSLDVIGEKFENLDIFLPEMTIAARIVQTVNDQVLTPRVEGQSGYAKSTKGKVLIATVQGDLHDIGKNMVSLLLRVNGFEVFDLGSNVPPSVIIDEAEKNQVDIIALSSLLTTCLPYMKDVFNHLEGKGKRDQFAIIIGGAAVTPQFADHIGADGFGHSAAEAVKLCKRLIDERKK